MLSNVASATLNEPLTAEKVSIQSVYRYGDEITYSVSFENSGASTLSGVSVTDNLGTYTPPGGGDAVTPLTYLAPAILLIDGVYSGNIVPGVAAGQVTFTLPALAAGSRAQILYRATVNTFAPLTPGATITNTATISAAGGGAPVSADNTITVDEYAQVTVTKTMTPSSVVDGDVLTYTFVINNYGNASAENIVLRDAFDPAPQDITVQLNGVTQVATAYTYINGVLTFPAQGSSDTLSLPAATVTQDPTTGEVTIVPSSLTITVTGVL